jgi:hypothetical protein
MAQDQSPLNSSNLKALFEQSGISEEEFVRHFLEPIYPEQNPVIIDGIVYTQESDGEGGFNKVEQGPLEDILSDNLDMFLQLLKDRNIEEDIFIEWIAHHKTSVFDEKGLEKTVKDRLAQSQKPKQEIPPTTEQPKQTHPESLPKTEMTEGGKSLLGSIVSGIKNLFSGKDSGDPSGMSEGRILSEEQEKEQQVDVKGQTKQLAELIEIQGKDRTKKLSKEINIIDAIYDNFDKIMNNIRETAKEIEEDRHAEKEEQQAAKAVKEVLRNIGKITKIGITEDGNLHIESRDEKKNKQLSSFRLVGRLEAIRDRIQQTSEKVKQGSMDKALKGLGKVSLGTGGKDADKAEKSKTPNDPSKDKEKSKEIG